MMAGTASGRLGSWPLLKLKLTGDLVLDAERVRAVREARGDAWIGVDANQGYEADELAELLKVLAELQIALLEQPLARGNEAALDGMPRPLPFAADESVCNLSALDRAVAGFDVVNIKLGQVGRPYRGARAGPSLPRSRPCGDARQHDEDQAGPWRHRWCSRQLCAVVDLERSDLPRNRTAQAACSIAKVATSHSAPVCGAKWPRETCHPRRGIDISYKRNIVLIRTSGLL